MANLNFLGAKHSCVLGKVSPPLDGQALLGLANWLAEPLDSRCSGDNSSLTLPPLSVESQQALYNLGLDNWSNTLNLDMAEK